MFVSWPIDVVGRGPRERSSVSNLLALALHAAESGALLLLLIPLLTLLFRRLELLPRTPPSHHPPPPLFLPPPLLLLSLILSIILFFFGGGVVPVAAQTTEKGPQSAEMSECLLKYGCVSAASRQHAGGGPDQLQPRSCQRGKDVVRPHWGAAGHSG
eukprot:8465906-Pyramimonas_sp.AAC.2